MANVTPLKPELLSYNSLPEMFAHVTKKYEGQHALENMGVWMTYGQLYRHASALANYFQQELGLHKGDRVAIMLPNLLQQPICFHAALMAGLVVVNVNPLYTPRELQFQLADSGAKCLIVLENMAHVAQKALEEVDVPHVLVSRIGDCFPYAKGLLVNSVVKYVKKMVPRYHLPQARSFRAVLRQKRGHPHQPSSLQRSDLALLQYTGGTTGVPKSAMLTHGNLLANIYQCDDAFMKKGVGIGIEIGLLPLPLYHIYAAIASLVFLYQGNACVLVTNPRDIPGLLKTMSAYPHSMMVMINTLLVAVMAHPDFEKVDFSNLKFTLTGGMATQTVVASNWQERTGCMVDQGYGLSETSPVVSLTAQNEGNTFLGHVGPPVIQTELKIVDEDGHELAVGQPGELCVKGPQVMQGYWNKPDETAKVLDDQGWFRTGDIATLDDAGNIHIVDRLKDMIIVSGFNVYPNEVEEIMAACPGVQEVGVVGENNAEGNEVVKAYVVRKDPKLTKKTIQAHCREQLTSYKVPKIIEFIDALPKTPVGKILRKDLRKTA